MVIRGFSSSDDIDSGLHVWLSEGVVPKAVKDSIPFLLGNYLSKDNMHSKGRSREKRTREGLKHTLLMAIQIHCKMVSKWSYSIGLWCWQWHCVVFTTELGFNIWSHSGSIQKLPIPLFSISAAVTRTPVRSSSVSDLGQGYASTNGQPLRRCLGLEAFPNILLFRSYTSSTGRWDETEKWTGGSGAGQVDTGVFLRMIDLIWC